jgi:hypothetical protein
MSGECYQLTTLTKVGYFTVRMEKYPWLNDVGGVETEVEAVILDEAGHIVIKEIGGWVDNPDMVARMPSWAENVDKWNRPNEHSTIPLVLLTGHSVGQEMDQLQVQGLAGWLAKPPSIEELSQLLAEVLKK